MPPHPPRRGAPSRGQGYMVLAVRDRLLVLKSFSGIFKYSRNGSPPHSLWIWLRGNWRLVHRDVSQTGGYSDSVPACRAAQFSNSASAAARLMLASAGCALSALQNAANASSARSARSGYRGWVDSLLMWMEHLRDWHLHWHLEHARPICMVPHLQPGFADLADGINHRFSERTAFTMSSPARRIRSVAPQSRRRPGA